MAHCKIEAAFWAIWIDWEYLHWLCEDCKKHCAIDNKDYYMIKHDLWDKIGVGEDMLCMDCLEKRLGHKLTAKEILKCPLTMEINEYTKQIINNRKNNMNVLGKLEAMLVECGLFESQAKEILNLAVPVLDKAAVAEINGTEEIEGETKPISPYQIKWDLPWDHYEIVMYNLWFASIKPIALKWVDDNKPEAWCRAMFL